MVVNQKQRTIVYFVLHAVFDRIDIHYFDIFDNLEIIVFGNVGFIENVGDTECDNALLII
ncbi:hypothetical protein D3C79_595560 [compost metagenome]